jgi:predicted metal-dependent peptidase
MTMEPVPKPGLGTFAVDEWSRLYYDPALLKEWTLDQCAAVVLHESAHVFLNHCGRCREYLGAHPTDDQLEDWRMAADAVVNHVLRQSKVDDLPAGAVYPETINVPTDKTCEECYEILAERRKQKPPTPKPQPGAQGSGQQKANGQGQGGQQPDKQGGKYDGPKPDRAKGEGGSGSDGQQKPWEDGPPEEYGGKPGAPPGLGETEKAMIRRATAKAMEEHDKHMGNLPGALQRMVDEILRPAVDPWKELRARVKYAASATNGRGDYTWKKLPRRAAPGGLRLPAQQMPNPRVIVIADTSGSMGAKDLTTCLGVIQQGLRAMPRGSVLVVAADTQCQGAAQKVFRPEQVILLGGGGTDMGKAIEEAAEMRPAPDAIIVVTDGETGWPSREVFPRVVAAITRKNTAHKVPKWIETVVVEA